MSARPLPLWLLAPALALACGGHEGDHGHPHPAEGAEAGPAEHSEDHEHAEDPLGTVALGEHRVELAQGHGAVLPGKECPLVVKLPYSDKGSTVVRAWIGGEDRTLSYVGKGEYAPAHDDYDVHATAPDPLPEGARWWVELELPDGSRLLGSAEPILE